ncbi:MAG: RNA polymerase sigma factor [Desulfomonilaceae bacterium]
MNFWEIYDQYYFRVKRVIRGIVRDEWLADDLTQETFVRVQDRLGDLRDPAKLSSWIFRIAYNLCQDHFREVGKSVIIGGADEQDMEIPEEDSVQKEFEQHQMSQCVQIEIDRLPESLRTVLFLSDVMEFSHREIAEVVGITVENVKVRLHRARKRLKELLEQKCTFETDERNVLVCEPKDMSSS